MKETTKCEKCGEKTFDLRKKFGVARAGGEWQCAACYFDCPNGYDSKPCDDCPDAPSCPRAAEGSAPEKSGYGCAPVFSTALGHGQGIRRGY